MTDNDTDRCGHPTQGGDGPPCQHPATDGDSCWIPEHGGNGDAGGREFKIDESDHDDIIDAAEKGLSKAGCARAAGVDKASLLRYLDEHDEFRTAFTRARARGEQRLATAPLYDREGEPDVDGQHARFLLSTSFDYIKTEKKELTGEGGGPVEVRELSKEEKEQLNQTFDRKPQSDE